MNITYKQLREFLNVNIIGGKRYEKNSGIII